MAVKKIARHLAAEMQMERELLAHSRLRHPHIVKFHQVFLSPSHINLVLEYVPGTEGGWDGQRRGTGCRGSGCFRFQPEGARRDSITSIPTTSLHTPQDLGESYHLTACLPTSLQTATCWSMCNSTRCSQSITPVGCSSS